MQTNNRSLLVVDDEQKVINSLKRLFRHKGYTIYTSNNAEDALHILHDDPGDEIGVVLTDFQMPDMQGTDLLAEVKKIRPETRRILLTGQADEVSVNSAVNQGALHKFLGKPWDNQSLLNTVDDAFQQFELANENRRLTKKLEQANADLTLLNTRLEVQIKEKAEQLIRITYYDELTGLPSKVLIHDRLKQEIKLAGRSSSSVSVMLIGIDNLSMVNQSLGKKAGDKLLLAVAERLGSIIQACDTLSRLSSDLFCLLFSHKNTDKNPEHIAEILMSTMRSPFVFDKQTVFLTASVGVSLYPVDSDNADDLFSYAESAMQQVKSSGKNNYQFYSKKFGRLINKRFMMESDLRRAVEHEEFCLYYQPRIDINQSRIVGVEALMRWNHPEKGLIAPNEFISLLEETGMIDTVGAWLIKNTVKTLKSWQDQGLPDIHMAINLSARQFYQGKILEFTQDAINKFGLNLNRSRLEYEITESILIEDVASAQKILTELHNMGIVVAIDDFGTGYSSLSYLTKFPVHYLKIDRSFIVGIEHSKSDKAIVGAIISLAHSLNMQVIAEGIETSEQLHELTMMGCQEYQGFLFSRPVPELELIKMLESGKGKIVYNG